MCSKPAHLRSIFVAGEQSERVGIPERHATAAGYRFEKKPRCVYVREINTYVELMFGGVVDWSFFSFGEGAQMKGSCMHTSMWCGAVGPHATSHPLFA